MAIFEDLIRKYNLSNAKEVILSGGSAGGLAAYTWTNYLRKILSNDTNLRTIVDAGFFVDEKDIISN